MSVGIHASFTKRFSSGPEIRIDAFETPGNAALTVLFGPSGAGKTTVLRCLAGLAKPDQGTIRFNHQIWSDAAKNCFVPCRERKIGYMPQEYALFPHLSVERNIAFGLSGVNTATKRSRIAEMISWLHLEGLEKRMPRELSGGQQQRVALGRALAPRPGLLLLDDPLGALDSPTRVRLRSELRQLLKEAAIPAILVTHDRTDALALGDTLAVMSDGRLLQQGPVQDVFSRPATLSVAEIVAVETVIPGRVLQTADLVTVEVGSHKLIAAPSRVPADATHVFVCIRAEDVVVVKGQPEHTSPRNSLRGIVKSFVPEGPMVSIELDCGFSLRALLTKQATQELAIKPGDLVHALVKAPNVHLIPRSSPL
jgi:molybdate transport system ATP-binding protein